MKTKKLVFSRVRQILLAAVCVLFVAGNFAFHFGGRWVRDLLSPEVAWVYPEYTATESGKYALSLPKSAAFEEDGRRYVYGIRPSEAYPEVCYEVYRQEIFVLEEDDERMYLSFSGLTGAERVVKIPVEGLADGTRVLMAESER